MIPISREEEYGIQMALIRNHGYMGRRDGNVVEVHDHQNGVPAAVVLSADGSHWVIHTDRPNPLMLPRETPPADLADAIVDEIRRTD